MKKTYGTMLALLIAGTQSMAALVPVLEDNFDPGLDAAKWSDISLGTAATGAAFLDGNALWFNGTGVRSATTIALNMIGGGNVVFDFRAGNETVDGTSQWENSEGGENVVLEYSTDGSTFTQFLTLDTIATTTWDNFDVAIPVAAQSESTSIRWRQLSNDGPGFDHWAIDNVEISAIPEPATLGLMGLSSGGLFFIRKMRRRKKAGITIMPVRSTRADEFTSTASAVPVRKSKPVVQKAISSKLFSSTQQVAGWKKSVSNQFFDALLSFDKAMDALKKKLTNAFDAFLALILK